jgi:hypothetical protein
MDISIIYIHINNDYTWMSGCLQSIYSWLIYWVISYTPLFLSDDTWLRDPWGRWLVVFRPTPLKK